MAQLQPGAKFLQEGTLKECLYEDPAWGGIWRGEHVRHGLVLFVAYVTPDGRRMLGEALPSLERWRTLAAGTAPGLIPIHEINADAQIPHLVVKGTEGETLLQLCQHGVKDNRGLMKVFMGLAQTLVLSKTYEIPFANIAPWTAIRVPGDNDAPWQFIPVAPGVQTSDNLVAGGRYVPPELVAHQEPLALNADVYSLSRIAIEALTDGFDSSEPPEALGARIPYGRLRMILTNGLKTVKGAYDDPKMVQVALQRWIKHESEEDMKEHLAAVAAQSRSALGQKFHNARRPIVIAASAFVGLLLGLSLIFCVIGALRIEQTENTPYGLIHLYFGEVVEGNAEGARGYTIDAATPQTDRLLADIRRMEETGLASRFAAAVPRVAGDGPVRTAKIDLRGTAGDVFMQVEVTLREQSGGEWRISDLYFEPLREPEGN